MKAILDKIGMVIVMYGLALGFMFGLSFINLTEQAIIFVVMPLPYVIAMYMFLGIKDVRHEASEVLKAYETAIETKREQIKNYKTLDIEHYKKVAELNRDVATLQGLSDLKDTQRQIHDIEILMKGELVTELKGEIYDFNNILYDKKVKPIDSIFVPIKNVKVSTYSYTCCNKPMREAKTMYICDWCKKRKKKPIIPFNEFELGGK